MARIEKRRSGHLSYRILVQKSRSGEPSVYRIYPGWAVAVSRRGVMAMKRRGDKRLKGYYWPIYGIFRGKLEAKTRISDAVANGEWPKGWLVAVPVYSMDSLRDGVFA
jgi:hypothetical protein